MRIPYWQKSCLNFVYVLTLFRRLRLRESLFCYLGNGLIDLAREAQRQLIFGVGVGTVSFYQIYSENQGQTAEHNYLKNKLFPEELSVNWGQGIMITEEISAIKKKQNALYIDKKKCLKNILKFSKSFPSADFSVSKCQTFMSLENLCCPYSKKPFAGNWFPKFHITMLSHANPQNPLQSLCS